MTDVTRKYRSCGDTHCFDLTLWLTVKGMSHEEAKKAVLDIVVKLTNRKGMPDGVALERLKVVE